MAKSLRSKVKRSFRSKKREEGVYAAAAAGRLQRLNAKLTRVTLKDDEAHEEGEDLPADGPDDSTQDQSVMDVDTPQPTKVSTHGPRTSRRDEWRKSKGLAPRPTPNAMNRQGGLAARRKAGRSKRRR